MSMKKSFYPFAVFISSTVLLILFSIYLLVPRIETPENDIYTSSAESTVFFQKFYSNQDKSKTSIKENSAIANKWIKSERSKISNHFFYRRKAYDLIAKEILTVKNIDQLNYHLDRLPLTEKQAFTTLTVNRYSITTLNNYTPNITGLSYPIRLPGKEIDGKDLLISSTYSSKRISPVGAGGTRPHHAVDIINIGNIDYISEEGILVRNNNHPGYIVSVADGIVTNVEYNHIYGWNVTVEHDRSLIPDNNRSDVLNFETFYAHLDEKIFVKKGDHLNVGDNISLVGNSGLSTGPHLHYEVRINNHNGTQIKVNPFPGSEW